MATEQINAEGGILGKQVEVIGEDSGDLESDAMTVRSSLIRLLTYHKVDFIIGSFHPIVSDTIAEHKKIFISCIVNNIEEQVLNDYDKYKYLFSIVPNATSTAKAIIDSLQTLRENTDFTKVAYLFGTGIQPREIMDRLDTALPELGYEIVYRGIYPQDTFDFSSYFAQAEAAGAEILIPWSGGFNGASIVKEYHDRQSPMLIYSGLLAAASVPDSWEYTEGKCEYLCVSSNPLSVGYPLTSKTLPAREAYIERWGAIPGIVEVLAYDMIRFTLPDAIERAGTTDPDALVEALEQTNVVTTTAKSFAFSSSHGLMNVENMDDSDAFGKVAMVFQWQNGNLVPVHPRWIREEEGTTLTFPDWSGPWDK